MSEGVISSRSDYAVGQTLDISLNPSTSPFTDESQKNFINAFSEKKQSSNIDNQGECEMYCTLVQKESDRTTALGINGSLKMTYGPVSGDANVQFAMDNIQGSLELTMVIRGKQSGRIIKNDLTPLIDLKLRDSVKYKIKNDNTYTIEEFKKEYGSYLIYGYDYGGEINFTSKYSTNSSSDKMSVGGALSINYKEMGFNIEGSVDGNYKSEDVSKSTNIETKYTILPSYDSELINGDDGIITLLNEISNPTTTTTSDDSKNDSSTSIELHNKMQKLLGGVVLDPVKAIIYPIENIGCVADGFAGFGLDDEDEEKSDGSEIIDSVGESTKIRQFFQAMNPLYQSLKEILQAVITINDNYDKNIDPTMTEKIELYLKALDVNIKQMEIIEGEELYTKADEYEDYIMSRKADDGNNNDDNEPKYEVQKEFYKIDNITLQSQFNKDLLNPYDDMMTKLQEDESKEELIYDPSKLFIIRLKGNFDNRYICAASAQDKDGKLYLTQENWSSTRFTSIPQGTNEQGTNIISLYSANRKKYVHIDGPHLNANQDQINGNEEKFNIIVRDNGKFALQSIINSRYFKARPNETHFLCDGTDVNDEAAQFEIEIINE